MAKKRANGEGTIRQRKDGRWEGLYTVNYKRKSVYGKTQDEVRKRLNKVLNDIDSGMYIENANITFGAWLDEWLEVYAKPSVKLSTYGSYEGYIRNHIKPEIGKIKLSVLRADMLQKFINQKLTNGRCDKVKDTETKKLVTRKGGLSEKTIKNMYNMIHSALKQAYRNGLVNQNVSELITLPKQKRNEMCVLTVDEQRALQTAVQGERLGIGIILSLFTGIRLGELLGLKFEDIDLDAKTITIRRTLNRLKVFDNPDKKTDIVIGEPKTNKAKRVIPLQDFLIPLLKAHKAEIIKERFKASNLYKNDGFVICNEFGGYIEPRTYQDFFKRMLKKAEIKNTNFHTLRHTFATRALENGFDVKVLADILGHADASTTLNKYAHALPDHKKTSMEKLSCLYERGCVSCV
ncbi:MAG: site-specific integrase [Clostridia bacterium]|nr:site-specific integrase [Clostridia bacterium]